MSVLKIKNSQGEFEPVLTIDPTQEVVDWMEENATGTVTSTVEGWLDENITQETGYVLDRTLTANNAAAPADLVGDLTSHLKEMATPEYTWTLGSVISNTGSITTNPSGARSAPISVSGGEIISRQLPVTDNDGHGIIIHVNQYEDGVWQSRTSLSIDGLTLNSSTTSIVFNCARSASESIVMTQADIDAYFNAEIYRKYECLPHMVKYLKSVEVKQSSASTDYDRLLSNLPANSMVWTVNTWWDDAPASGFFYCLTLKTIDSTTLRPTATQGMQLAIYPDKNDTFMRRIKSGAWADWVSKSGSSPVYYAFGDSITWGAVWDSDQATPLYQADLSDQIPTRIAHAVGSISFMNKGVSGARYVKQSRDSASSKTIVDRVKETSFTGVDLVTIGGGRNDSATALGDGETAAANDGTICGAIVDILEYLTTNYPTLQIVVYGVTPQPDGVNIGPQYIFTRVFSGGWSLNAFYAEVSKVCARYNVPFVDWYGCTLILRWGVLSGGYSEGVRNWSHPLDSYTYKQLGNYLAGQVAQYYSG